MRFAVCLSAIPLLLCGCHSAMVDATVHNSTNQEIRLIEVDYPSASFGVQRLLPGQDFRYRFKVLGSGDLKVTYTTEQTRQHTQKGPPLHEGQEGQLIITLTPGGATWSPRLHG